MRSELTREGRCTPSCHQQSRRRDRTSSDQSDPLGSRTPAKHLELHGATKFKEERKKKEEERRKKKKEEERRRKKKKEEERRKKQNKGQRSNLSLLFLFSKKLTDRF